MRELVQLAKPFVSSKHSIAGRFLSEKMDGSRALWVPTSRGMRVGDVPFSNLNKNKDKKVDKIATGLWSRYGNVINCPDYWCEDLPDVLLDGELYLGRGEFQSLRSIVSRQTPNEETWKNVRYRIFDAPNESFWTKDKINNPNFQRDITDSIPCTFVEGGTFTEVYEALGKLSYGDFCDRHEQEQLSWCEFEAGRIVSANFCYIVDKKGEGVMLRCPDTLWFPKRNTSILKMKPRLDAEGAIIGYVMGKGKHKGRMGSLMLRWNGVEFNIHGFTNPEREIVDILTMTDPGDLVYGSTKHFELGSLVTFDYRELTNDGIPKDATYHRKYEIL